MKFFLSGDVMLGRGVDQILSHPSDPRLHESAIDDAVDYVRLAERVNGPIPRKVGAGYVWGHLLAALDRQAPDVRIINLETSVTESDDWVEKGINYRMHPANVSCVTAARIDCCVLANNHVMDFGPSGLVETLRTLHAASVRTAGAGVDLDEAASPAVLAAAGARALVFGVGTVSSGIPWSWRARRTAPGVHLLSDAGDHELSSIAGQVVRLRRPGDIVIASIHWGSNWGYTVPDWQRRLAHDLVDHAGVDVVHGHSSHHPKGIEVYGGKPILYGCGDLLNDYEGIGEHDEYRDDLALAYFVEMDSEHRRLESLRLTPLRLRRFSLQRASREEALWLRDTLDRESAGFGTHVGMDRHDALMARWS